MNKRRRNPSFPQFPENYGAQDPSNVALASRRAADDRIRKYVINAMKPYKPLVSLDKAGIIKEAEYYETQAVGRGAPPGSLDRYIVFKTGKGKYPQLVLDMQWSGFEELSFRTEASPLVSVVGYDDPEDIKLVCDLMRYTVTNKPAKFEAAIDELVSRGRM